MRDQQEGNIYIHCTSEYKYNAYNCNAYKYNTYTYIMKSNMDKYNGLDPLSTIIKLAIIMLNSF